MNTADDGGSAQAWDDPWKRWPSLIRSAETGHLPIVHNPVETTLRALALGQKNGSVVGSERAGPRAAAIQTRLGTAQLNGIDPAAWLRDTLAKLPTGPHRRLDEWLPFPHSAEDVKALEENDE